MPTSQPLDVENPTLSIIAGIATVVYSISMVTLMGRANARNKRVDEAYPATSLLYPALIGLFVSRFVLFPADVSKIIVGFFGAFSIFIGAYTLLVVR